MAPLPKEGRAAVAAASGPADSDPAEDARRTQREAMEALGHATCGTDLEGLSSAIGWALKAGVSAETLMPAFRSRRKGIAEVFRCPLFRGPLIINLCYMFLLSLI